MKRLMILLPVMLAGCNSQPGVTMSNVSASEVANKVAAANTGEAFLSPGHWQGTVKIAHFDMPGAPPQMAAHMAQAIAKDRPIESCLTPEEAKRPKGAFFGGDDANCRYDHFTMAGGVIDAVMRCERAGGAKQVMTMKGKYAPDSYQMAMTMKSEGGADMGANMSMAMNVTAARTGACTGKETG
jgi:hypothetical protein